ARARCRRRPGAPRRRAGPARRAPRPACPARPGRRGRGARLPRAGRGGQHVVDDLRVAGAATQVAGEGLADVVHRRRRILSERRLRDAGTPVERQLELHASRPIAARTLAANSLASWLALTFMTASPTAPSRPSTRTSLRYRTRVAVGETGSRSRVLRTSTWLASLRSSPRPTDTR